MMKRLILILSLSWGVLTTYGQITLEECWQKTKENYPLVKQYGLIEKAKEYTLHNASKGYLPQFTLSAKATYQSDVTELPVTIPGANINKLPKDQYQMMLELKQNIWDGGEIQKQKELVKSNSEVDRQRIEVDMYALNERVNQLYFGILLVDEQLKQNQLLQQELGRSHQQIMAYAENGIANQSDIDAVRVEQLHTKQKRVELSSLREAYLKMLSLMVGENLSAQSVLSKPLEEEITVISGDNKRPELTWFEAQGGRLHVQEAALKVRSLPRLSAFVQGAYGNPGLNMLKNEFTPYYIAGVRLLWNFGSLYTLHNDKKLIATSREQLLSNRDVFLFNTQLQVAQQSSAIGAMKEQMRDDDEIIQLRTNIRMAAQAKVANGTLTVTDMLREITAESMARQAKAMHQVQLLMDVWQLKYTTNN